MKLKGVSKHTELLYFFDLAIADISINGKSLSDALKDRMPRKTFYEMIEKDPEKSNRYVRACELRTDYMAEEILSIADDTSEDVSTKETAFGVVEVENREFINRSKVRIDARKWLMAKMNPKKYSEKTSLDLEAKVSISQDTTNLLTKINAKLK